MCRKSETDVCLKSFSKSDKSKTSDCTCTTLDKHWVTARSLKKLNSFRVSSSYTLCILMRSFVCVFKYDWKSDWNAHNWILNYLHNLSPHESFLIVPSFIPTHNSRFTTVNLSSSVNNWMLDSYHELLHTFFSRVMRRILIQTTSKWSSAVHHGNFFTINFVTLQGRSAKGNFMRLKRHNFKTSRVGGCDLQLFHKFHGQSTI